MVIIRATASFTCGTVESSEYKHVVLSLIFLLPEESRWSFIQKQAKQDDIAVKIDTAPHTVKKTSSSTVRNRPAPPTNWPR